MRVLKFAILFLTFQGALSQQGRRSGQNFGFSKSHQFSSFNSFQQFNVFPQPNGFQQQGGFQQPSGFQQPNTFPKPNGFPRLPDFPQQNNPSQFNVPPFSNGFNQNGNFPAINGFPGGFFPAPPQPNTPPRQTPSHVRLPRMDCQAVEFGNRTENGWNGIIWLAAAGDIKNAQVDIGFDDFVPIFTNNLGHSSSTNNKVFSVTKQSVDIKKGEKLKIEFFAKSNDPLNLPSVTSLKFNNASICSDYDDRVESDSSCARLVMKKNASGGRWDALLTLNSGIPVGKIRVDIELDRPAWALGNDFGETKTSNQKRFTITQSTPVRSDKRVAINLFVKYDELEEIPQIKRIFVNGAPVCIDGLSTHETEALPNFEPTSQPPTKGIKLTELPFNRYPNVTTVPFQVNNDNVDCGLSSVGLQNRFNQGSRAEIGEFPFHVALFRDNVYICGGSLISQKTVITACHCVVNDNKVLYPLGSFKLLFGATDLRSLSGDEALREVAEIIKHPDYEFDTILKQDIALMIIKGGLRFTPFISPICLYDFQPPIENLVNRTGTVLGFGASESSREPSRYLNHGLMSVITRQQCIESKLIFGLLPEKSAFCAKAVQNMIACPGDSGGGLIRVENGKYFLRGISSVTITGANGQCDSTQSVAFTDVTSFLPWIRQNVRD